MFKRILHEDWATYVPIISFVVIFVFFLVATLRALALNKVQREHLAALPLADDGEINSEIPTPSQSKP
jgi:ABC-type uncharacterized transport system permease subunit